MPRQLPENTMMKPYGYFFIGLAAVCGVAASIAIDRVPPNALPNHDLTPGAVRTTDVNEVCSTPFTSQYRHWSRETGGCYDGTGHFSEPLLAVRVAIHKWLGYSLKDDLL